MDAIVAYDIDGVDGERGCYVWFTQVAKRNHSSSRLCHDELMSYELTQPIQELSIAANAKRIVNASMTSSARRL